MTDQDQLPIKLFIEESTESLTSLEQDLLALEGTTQAPDSESINRMFRIIHTVKGGAFFFGPQALKELSHSMETLLDKVRRNEIPFTPQIATVLLRSIDSLRNSLEEMKTGAPAAVPADQNLDPPPDPSVASDPAILADLLQKQEPAPPPVTASPAKFEKPADSSVRVNVKVLDALMNQAGELVLSRNALIQSTGSRNERWIENATQRINAITSELQETIMSTRMQSVGIVFTKFRRMVRDLALKLDKKAELEIHGEEVELDKTIIEALGDPLTHLVRNALDHGIESQEARQQAGKNETGKLVLRAVHKAGQVVIELADDGGGLKLDRIRAKALAQGLFSKQQLDSMTEKEIANLIFRPGFSTANEVTEISGRGVGMDVVHSNLAKIGGTVDLDSIPGKGTTIRIKLPLTLAIIPSLLIRVGEDRFAIPQVNVRSLIRVPARNVKKMIQKIGEAHVLRLREELLPIFRLRDVLGLDRATYIDPETGEMKPERRKLIADRRSDDLLVEQELEDKRSGEDRRYSAASALHIAVVSAGDFFYGIIVDSLLDSAEIVVKPLGRHVHRAGIYAGATILGDGKVALILDVIGISNKAGIQKIKTTDLREGTPETASVPSNSDYYTLLLIENHPGERLAIPLDMVARVEKICANSIEEIAGKKTLKYRGGSLPITCIEEVAPLKKSPTTGNAYIIVYRANGREFGLLAHNIHDVVTLMLEIDTVTHKQPGILGSTIIHDKITPVLDLFDVAKKTMPTHFQENRPQKTVRVLIADDSAFFRGQIANYIREEGYEAVLASDGKEAWEILNNSTQPSQSPFDIVLTDIEMPRMTGLEFTSRIRADSRFSSLPVIAITSLTAERDRQEGYSRGVDSYMAKLDRQLIVEQCRMFIQHGRKAAALLSTKAGAETGASP